MGLRCVWGNYYNRGNFEADKSAGRSKLRHVKTVVRNIITPEISNVTKQNRQ